MLVIFVLFFNPQNISDMLLVVGEWRFYTYFLDNGYNLSSTPKLNGFITGGSRTTDLPSCKS